MKSVEVNGVLYINPVKETLQEQGVAPEVILEIELEMLKVDVLAERDQLMTQVSLQITPLQDADDLGMATPEESSRLITLKRYRVELSRIESQVGYPHNVVWPDSVG